MNIHGKTFVVLLKTAKVYPSDSFNVYSSYTQTAQYFMNLTSKILRIGTKNSRLQQGMYVDTILQDNKKVQQGGGILSGL